MFLIKGLLIDELPDRHSNATLDEKIGLESVGVIFSYHRVTRLLKSTKLSIFQLFIEFSNKPFIKSIELFFKKLSFQPW